MYLLVHVAKQIWETMLMCFFLKEKVGE